MNYFKFFILTIILCLFYSCDKDLSEVKGQYYDEDTLASIVEDRNIEAKQRNGISKGDIRVGFLADGVIFSKLNSEKLDDKFLAINFNKSTDNRREEETYLFNFGLNEDIKFPEKIKSGRVVFLGNQLLITDLSTKKQWSFFVPTMNQKISKTPKIENSFYGNYLVIEKL